MRVIIKFFLFYFALFFLFSCYDQTVTINKDGFIGIITYKVAYYNDYDNLLSYIINVHNIDLNSYLFFDKKDLDKIITKYKNTSIVNYSLKSTDNGRISEVSFNYNNFDNFPAETPYVYFPVRIYEENKNVYYSTTLSIFNQAETKQIIPIYKKLGKKEKELIDGYLSLIKFKFIYRSYEPIIYFNIGNISKDKKELVYETTLYDLINSKDEININFYFKK